MDDMQALAEVVGRAIQASHAGLLARVALLEKQIATTGRDGRDGADVDMEAVAALVKAHVDAAVAGIAVPRDGRDGTSVTVADVEPLVKSVVAEAVAALPQPMPGEKGEPGESVSEETVDAMVARHVSKAFSDLPLPKDGASVTVEDVSPLISAEVAKAIAAIPMPRDGVGLANALIDRDEHLVLTLTDGTTKDVGLVVGRDVDMAVVTKQVQDAIDAIPRPKDGVDGLGFEDIAVEHDGERAFTLKFVRGDVTKAFGAFTIPAQIYRGVFKAGTVYTKGDVVTWGGHQWTCIEDATTAKPGEASVESRAWQQSVKRGGEGKQGMPGQKGLDGKDGRNGLDLTQMDTDGRKWR